MPVRSPEANAATPTPSSRRTTGGAVALAVAGLGFLLYALLRPAADDIAAMGSAGWVVAHLCAVAGFVLLPIGLGGLWLTLTEPRSERAALAATVVTAVGTGLTLPYYGAEDFGLHAVAQQYVARPDPGLLELPDAIRFAPAAAATFSTGLLLLAVGGVLAAVAIHRSSLPSLAGVPLALGLLLFVPQFFAPAPLRIAHGLLLFLGCLSIAAVTGRTITAARPAPTAPAPRPTADERALLDE